MSTLNADLDLDVSAPDKVAAILRAAAQRFYESDVELSAACQDKNAGKPWSIIARELERCADRIEAKL